MKIPQFFLGVDGGATKTEAVLVDQNRKIIDQGQAQGSNTAIFGLTESANQVALAVKRALGTKKIKISASYLALAGVNTRDDNKNWQRAIKNHPYLCQVLDNPKIVNDTAAALRSGTTDKNAIVVIAGTGSNCYGRNEKGQEARSGGADHILGDEGSAYDIGSNILHSVVKALDGRGPKTVLVNLLFEKLKIESLDGLHRLVYKKPWNKTDIAQVAPLAEIAAEKNDKIAIGIIKSAADELALMTKAVAQKLNLEKKPYTIVKSGSVFNMPKIGNLLEKEILKFSPYAKFTMPKVSAATAAAYLAQEGI